MGNIFTCIKAPRKLWLMLFEAKGSNKLRRDGFTRCRTLNKLEPMYLLESEINFQQIKFENVFRASSATSKVRDS